MTIDKRILIVGGGIGGMAAAIRLAELGAQVDLIDLDPDWKVYGAGITITGPTLRAYRRLGLIEAIRKQGAISAGSRMFTFQGQHLRDLDEPALEEGLPATGGIMRPILHKIMQERVHACGVNVTLGVTVSDLQHRAHDVVVTRSDGAQGIYDLVVGADSVFSGVRRQFFPHMAEPVPTGQACWRIAIQRPPGLERGEMYFGHPTYTAGITACSTDKVYLWLLTPHHGERVEDDQAYGQMKALLADFGGNVGWIRDHMAPTDWINCRPLTAALQPRPWRNGRVVLLGDAVHATTPHLASGAGIAVESALVLAEELVKALRAGHSIDVALKAYEDRRYERCRDVIETSVQVGKMQLAGANPMQIGGLIGAALHRLAAEF